ncbi:hypothetical protein [uncultured Campylobacter sp.]|uniref:hypothetical protein n=1 Tax=uncultured Campylobacter sp. TaxID=218934 RepID=UPI00260B36E8|nr:hypothetical protein [uncultured Campylobacter sp.]
MAHFIVWVLTKHLKFYLSGSFDVYLAGREMTDRNLKTKGGFSFGNFAILANCKSRVTKVNLIRKFRYQIYRF